ncbi:hypothetical protein SLEP1_g59791 [Rubroshorea leprosula]|uniref:Uncharacterized protein n=1 Tax=Rubroshorea leprosula TaxID=152421 RepID=A0AAV5MTE3_9ROSI|nr:hypothetical protein SLEP1_g59791 [Rubroshorea leprosula]
MGALTAAAHVPSLHIPPTSTTLHRVRFTKSTSPNIPISSRNMSKFKLTFEYLIIIHSLNRFHGPS